MVNDPTQQELVQRIARGDTEALAEYIRLNRQSLLTFIDRQLGTALRRKVEIEDILQELSTDAVRALANVNLGDRLPFSWLCQLAERRIIDAHRRYFGAQKRDAARERPIDAGNGDGGGLINMLVNSLTTPSAAFSRNAREVRVWEEIDQLPDEQQRALRLKYVDGWGSKQIAEELGKTDAAVRVMLTRTLRRLQGRLTDVEPS